MTMMEESYKKNGLVKKCSFIAAYDYLKSHKDCNGQVGVGFCFEVGLPI
jgi:carboxymethylenebutenolidase